MTTITINLPDDLTQDLKAKAAAWKMSLDEVLEEAAMQFILNDESRLEPVELTPDEIAAIARAEQDIAEGRTFSHEEVMAEMRQWRRQ